MGPLSHDLDRDDAQPYFIWDIPVTMAEVRRWLRDPDDRPRALWMARVMREARYDDVWKLISLKDILDNYATIHVHLGRMRAFWGFLLDGWREDGLLPKTASDQSMTALHNRSK